MDVVDEALDVIDRCLRQHAVAEVEDVTGRAAGPIEHCPRARLNCLPGSEERRRVEVALDGDRAAEPSPRLAEVDPPIDADHVRAGGAESFEESSRTDAEEDDWYAGVFDRLDRSFRVGQNAAFVVLRAELATPTVEELDRLGTRFDLCAEIPTGGGAQLRHQRIPD